MPITHNPVHVPFGKREERQTDRAAKQLYKTFPTEIELKLKFKGLGRVTRARAYYIRL